MLYAQIGSAKISRLGFGCMRFPTLEDGAIDKNAALEMIDLAYQNGVNYFDTAYGYHNGNSELFVREALSRYPRDSYYLADKMPTWLCNMDEDLPRLFDEQLQKCGVSYFDFYLMHSLDAERWAKMKERDGYAFLLEKKRQGKIRHLGFSYHGDFDTFCEIIDTCAWDFVQIQINYVDDVMLDSRAYYNKLTAAGVPCFVMEPVRGGFLANLPEEARAELEALEPETSSAAWALRWCLNMDNMPVILSGMSSLEQVRDNLATVSSFQPLTQAEADAITRTRERILSIKTVPCTACRYCMDCSFGVDIPEVFGIYNRYKLFNDQFRTFADYRELGGHTAESCVACGACAPMCPQSIAIPDRLAEAHAEIGELKF